MLSSINVLGSSAAIPTLHRSPSCQILSTEKYDILLDCGEGSQMKMMLYGLKSSRIKIICITHLHGDHVFGLPGLLSSMALQGRVEPLIIIAPRGIKKLIDYAFQVSNAKPPFSINYIELEDNQSVHIDEKMSQHDIENPVKDMWTIKAVPLRHRVKTYGYIFKQTQQERHLLANEYFQYTKEYKYIADLKNGNDVITDEGLLIKAEDVTSEPDHSMSYAYITDTKKLPEIVDAISNISVLYHEATFLHEEIAKARRTMHSTAFEAAQIAKAANVKDLLLGHFSARYHDINALAIEAQQVFPKSQAVIEGKKYMFDDTGIVKVKNIRTNNF